MGELGRVGIKMLLRGGWSSKGNKGGETQVKGSDLMMHQIRSISPLLFLHYKGKSEKLFVLEREALGTSE